MDYEQLAQNSEQGQMTEACERIDALEAQLIERDRDIALMKAEREGFADDADQARATNRTQWEQKIELERENATLTQANACLEERVAELERRGEEGADGEAVALALLEELLGGEDFQAAYAARNFMCGPVLRGTNERAASELRVLGKAREE